MAILQDLPAECLRSITDIVDQVEMAHTQHPTLSALSATCKCLREIVLPSLWRIVHFTLHSSTDMLSSQRLLPFVGAHHPSHTHTRKVFIHLPPSLPEMEPVEQSRLDDRLAHALTRLLNLQTVCLDGHAPHYCWSATMNAISECRTLRDVTFDCNMPLGISIDHQTALQRLSVKNGYGACKIGLSAHANLREVHITMEDSGDNQCWPGLCIPPELWRTLKSLSMEGFCRDVHALLDKIEGSLSVGTMQTKQ